MYNIQQIQVINMIDKSEVWDIKNVGGIKFPKRENSEKPHNKSRLCLPERFRNRNSKARLWSSQLTALVNWANVTIKGKKVLKSRDPLRLWH